MKKRILFGRASLAILAAAVCVTVTTVNSNSTHSDLLSQNLEALTQNEGGTTFTCSHGYNECARINDGSKVNIYYKP